MMRQGPPKDLGGKFLVKRQRTTPLSPWVWHTLPQTTRRREAFLRSTLALPVRSVLVAALVVALATGCGGEKKPDVNLQAQIQALDSGDASAKADALAAIAPVDTASEIAANGPMAFATSFAP